MPLALSRTAFPWITRGALTAILAFAVLPLLLSLRPLPGLAVALALAIGTATLFAAVRRRLLADASPASAFVGS